MTPHAQPLTDVPAPHLPSLTEYWIDSLNDRSHVLIRPLQAQDWEREFQFIKRLSPEARRARFLNSFSEPSAELMEQLMDVQYPSSMAYVALVHDNGEVREIGVARYAQTHGQHCEFAVVVADDWQRKGLGRVLMEHLMAAARRNGFKQMQATDLASNVHLQRMLSGLGFASQHAPDDYSEVVHRCEL